MPLGSATTERDLFARVELLMRTERGRDLLGISARFNATVLPLDLRLIQAYPFSRSFLLGQLIVGRFITVWTEQNTVSYATGSNH